MYNIFQGSENMTLLVSFLLIVMSYLYGSIPFALVIGKLFYKTDVRTQGSGNLGGTNAGRVLGKKAGIAVIILDASKCCISILLSRYVAQLVGIDTHIIYLSALACVIGHCYPIFAGFRGGKAVSVAIGYALVTNVYAFIIAVVIFLVTLKISKYVSLASILGSSAILILSPWLDYGVIGTLTNACIVALLIYKHKDNIKRIREHTENKITWM